MPPKGDPTKPVTIVLRVTGGVSGNPASIAPKVGPLGLSPKKVADDVAKATKDWAGIKVPVKLVVLNRQATIEVTPSASALVVRALNEPKVDVPKGTPIFHKGNITFEDVIHIARTIRPRSMAKEFKGTVKEVVGTCVSIGCTVDGESPKEIMTKVVGGEFDDRFVNEK